MKTLLLLLILTVPSFAQDIRDFVLVGKHQDIAYLVDPVHVKVKDGKVQFMGLAGVSLGQEDKLEVIDRANYVYSLFEADCKTYQYTQLARKGVINGEKLDEKVHITLTAKKPQLMFFALERICKPKNLNDYV